MIEQLALLDLPSSVPPKRRSKADPLAPTLAHMESQMQGLDQETKAYLVLELQRRLLLEFLGKFPSQLQEQFVLRLAEDILMTEGREITKK